MKWHQSHENATLACVKPRSTFLLRYVQNDNMPRRRNAIVGTLRLRENRVKKEKKKRGGEVAGGSKHLRGAFIWGWFIDILTFRIHQGCSQLLPLPQWELPYRYWWRWQRQQRRSLPPCCAHTRPHSHSHSRSLCRSSWRLLEEKGLRLSPPLFSSPPRRKC